MAVTVRRLCRNLTKEYHIHLVAGAEGLGNYVEWVHIVEDYDVAEFLKGQELVMTTGIGNIKTTENLMKYVGKLYEKNAVVLLLILDHILRKFQK